MPESKAESPAQARPRRLLRSIARVTLLGSLAAMLALKFDSFLCGLFGFAEWSSAALVLLVPVGLAAAIYLAVMLILKCLRWNRTRFLRPLTFASILFVLYFAPVVLPPESHALGFWYWCKRNIDVPSTVQWAEGFQPPPPAGSQPATMPDCARDFYEVPYSQLPPELQRVLPPHRAERYEGGNLQLGPTPIYSRSMKTITLGYGSGMMGHWGITIGRNCARSSYRQDLRISDDAYVFWGE